LREIDGTRTHRVAHIREGSRFLGNSCMGLINQVGETLMAPEAPFQVVPEFKYLNAWLAKSQSRDVVASGLV